MNRKLPSGAAAILLSLLLQIPAWGADTKVYQCAVRLLLNPKETANDGYATATFVKTTVNDATQYYMVTAYHNLYGIENCTLNAAGNQSWHLEDASDGSSTIFADSFYVSRDHDIAVIPLKQTFGELEEQEVPFIELYKWLNNLGDVPEGANASAFGNPQVHFDKITFEPSNVGYRCTVSEYAPAKTRIPLLAETVGEDVRLMFVETLSIAPGFSGGPVIVSDDQFATGKLAGVVVGGVTKVERGRFAFACPGSAIYEGIVAYSKEAASARQTFARGQVVHRIPNGRGVVLRLRLADYTVWDKPIQIDRELGYATENAKIIDMRGRSNRHISDEDLKVLLRENRGRTLLFIDAEFYGTDFAGEYLPNVTFRNCNFYRVSFDGAVIPGATFHGCYFSPPPPAGGENFLFKNAYLAYGTVKILRSEENATQDEFLKVELADTPLKTKLQRSESAAKVSNALADLETPLNAIDLSAHAQVEDAASPPPPSPAPPPSPQDAPRPAANESGDQLFLNLLNSPLPYRKPVRE